MEDAFDATVAVVADDELRDAGCASAARPVWPGARGGSSIRPRRDAVPTT